jgi:hypothetical protein
LEVELSILEKKTRRENNQDIMGSIEPDRVRRGDIFNYSNR